MNNSLIILSLNFFENEFLSVNQEHYDILMRVLEINSSVKDLHISMPKYDSFEALYQCLRNNKCIKSYTISKTNLFLI